jgi:hypothetical protein
LNAWAAEARRTGRIRDVGVRLSREVGHAQTNVPRRITRHSPTGFEWGYGGSGPADLALNILLEWGCDRQEADRLYQEFKFDFLASVPFHGGVIEPATISRWLAVKRGRAICPGCDQPLDDGALLEAAGRCTSCGVAAKRRPAAGEPEAPVLDESELPF